jgi:hypothetical protein
MAMWAGRAALVIVTAGLAGLVGFGAGVRFMGSAQAPDPKDDRSWIMIRSYQAPNDREGFIRANVYAIQQFSDDYRGITVLANRIDVEAVNGSWRFEWPDDDEFAGTWCEILDLDGDGLREFILISGGRTARVVEFTDGRFKYDRSRIHGQLSSSSLLKLIDLNDDGLPEFVTGSSSNDVQVFNWTKADGFQTSPGQLADVYRRKQGSGKK